MFSLSVSRTRSRLRTALGVSAIALAACGMSGASYSAADPDAAVDHLKTASPIKHVIIIVGENRSFDHLFATYKPKTRGETVLNLLSEKIVNADGSPGPNFKQGHQFQIVSAPNNGKFFISADLKDKQLYQFLPPPDLGGTPPVSPLAFILQPPIFPPGDPGLPPEDQFLFGTGGSGLAVPSPFLGPDTRITNVNALPPGPFQLTGPNLPFDAFTADTVHQFFQMWQQADCAIDKEHVTKKNPTGCLHDLQSAIDTTFATPLGQTPHDTGQTMAFFNMQQEDSPFMKELADTFTMSDNYHQPVMGGTGADSIPLGFADQIFYSDVNGGPATPPPNRIYNPNPMNGTLNLYTQRAQWFNCSDPQAQPGIQAIVDYLNALPFEVDPKCDQDHFYPAVNISPAFNPDGSSHLRDKSGNVLPFFNPDGSPNTGTPVGTLNIIPPVQMRSIGDALNDKHIPWIYYSGGFNADKGQGNGNPGGYCTICNPFEHQLNYPSLVADHMRDVVDLFADIKAGTLPAVSYVKPDGAMDGHPNSSKWTLFEAFAKNIVELVQANKELFAETAIFITVDEGGAFYDSGFIQPVDFFGTGPRIPMIAISPFSKGGHISHVYSEHSSFVKFVEHNWLLKEKLSDRSRDNLPNPRTDDENLYVPRNMPAIGDLFDLFNFHRDVDHNDGDRDADDKDRD
jgi:phospholipase C